MLPNQQTNDILNQAELIVSAEKVQAAVISVAQEINTVLADMHPLLLSVMGGAVVFTGQLLPLLTFPLDFDYVHVSRYGTKQQGGILHWKVEPRENVAGRVVLVVDDILDEGETLAAVKQRVLDLGAAKFYSAVFADKRIGKVKPVRADFVGLELPNRFVFGFGMDIHGAWRNLPAVYATREK
ncbi:MAG: hypoxanthine-guanine phosphoribosyltransferase [Nitrosomonadales bacterium]|nr:hypoxanthine-guanine phosphoribosyltransferase [Nitrosomonadales bacterium]